jgi:hypothetical protein
MHRLDASLKPVVGRIGANDVLLVPPTVTPPLRTALDYYYGRHPVVVETARLNEEIRKYTALWGDVYILTDATLVPGVEYLATFLLVRDAYAKGHALDVLPRNSSSHQVRYFLYRADRAKANLLRSGDVIRFNRGGNSDRYLGAGWSGQEDTMRWTDGYAASLHLAFAEPGIAHTLEFEVLSYSCEDVIARVNGQVRSRWKFAPCDRYSKQRLALEKDDVGAGPVTVAFDLPGAISPSERNPAISDRRKLGISVRNVVVDDARK